MEEICFAIPELLVAYRRGTLTPVDIVHQVVTRIACYGDPAVWISRVCTEALLERAAALMTDPRSTELSLYGIPFAIKDNIDAEGQVTTAGCPAFATIASADASVVGRLLAAGAILVGKTNLDQFATGLVGTRSPYGAPRCVFDAAYISGGSSSGSAVAVAAGLVSFALGTDTAGSGRVPAAFNNIVGLKPTRGLIGTSGVLAACRSLDCVSILARTAGDASIVLAQAQGEDQSDPYSRAGRSIGLPEEAFHFGVLSGVDRDFNTDKEAEELYDAAIANLAGLGGIPVPIDYTPFRDVAALLYDGPYVAERLAAIEPFITCKPEAMDPIVRGIIADAARFSAVDAFKAQYRLLSLARQAASQWTGIDMLLLPTTPTIFKVADIASDPVRLNGLLGLYTNFVNLLDYAAIAIPAGFRSNGLPFGVTLIGPAFSDRSLARFGTRLHRAAGCGAGLDRSVAISLLEPDIAPQPGIVFAVAGAHLSGMPLNSELIALGAELVGEARTAADYRLVVLDTVPRKPGLVQTAGFVGQGVELELWRLSDEGFGRFVANLPQPMSMGKVALADGRIVSGFSCESSAVMNSVDITRFGGWRRYISEASGA